MYTTRLKAFYIPSSRWELVQLLALKYPHDKRKFERMEKKRLYAVFYRIRGGLSH